MISQFITVVKIKGVMTNAKEKQAGANGKK
jgi:hypothetical protein